MSWLGAGRRWFRSRYRRQPYDFWLALGTVLLSLPIGWGVLTVDQNLAFAMLILQMLIGAINFRLAAPKSLGPVTVRMPVFIYFVPPLTVLIGFWWVGPGLADETSGPVASVFLWLLVSYAAILFSFLIAVFIAVPLEMIGRAAVHLVAGRYQRGLVLAAVAGWILLVPAIALIGAAAVDIHTVAGPAQLAALLAILGLPGQYTVLDPGLLWAARVLFIVFVAGCLAARGLGAGTEKTTAAQRS